MRLTTSATVRGTGIAAAAIVSQKAIAALS